MKTVALSGEGQRGAHENARASEPPALPVRRKSTNKTLESQRAVRDEPARLGYEIVDSHRSLIAPGPLAYGHGTSGCFLLSNHEHVRNLAELSRTDLGAELLVALVDLNPQPSRTQFAGDLAAVVEELLREGQDGRLHRCQPQRERSGEVLDQDGDEALEGSVDCSMEDRRAV